MSTTHTRRGTGATNTPPRAAASNGSGKWDSGLPHALRSTLGPLDGQKNIAAVLREWSRSVQSDAGVWIERLTEAGGAAGASGGGDEDAVEWVDPISGCSAVHFAAKSGCEGVGDDDDAAVIMSDLIRKGADTNKPCAYAHMTPLHYAAYFGCSAVLAVLLHSRSATGQVDVDRTCDTRSNCTALHFAVMGGNAGCVKALVDAGANTELRDDCDHRPIHVARQTLAAPGEFDDAEALKEIVGILEKEGDRFINYTGPTKQPNTTSDHPPPVPAAHALPRHLGRSLADEVSDTSSVPGSQLGDEPINVGDRVFVQNKCAGLVRFKDKTKFKPGIWYGVQLDEPIGKNNGTVGYVTYFRTKPKHGVFVRRSRLTRLEASPEKHSHQHTSPVRPPSGRHHSGPAPFTAPTFRTQRSVRPDHGKAANQDHFSFSHRGSPTSSAHASPLSSPALSRRGTIKSQISTPAATPASTANTTATTTPSTTGTRTPRSRGRSSRSSSVRRKAGTSFRSEVPLHKRSPKTPKTPKTPGLGGTPDSFGIKSRVLCKGAVGDVAYVGPSHLGEGTYVGVVYSTAGADRHNGTVDDHFYFKCPPGRGTLVPATKAHWRGRRVDKVLADNR